MSISLTAIPDAVAIAVDSEALSRATRHAGICHRATAVRGQELKRRVGDGR